MVTDLESIRFRELILFDRLLSLGTLRAAAADLGIPKATASRWLAILESRMGQPLVIRGPRSVTPTEHGLALQAALPPLLGGLRAVRSLVGGEASGVVRVSVPVPLGRLFGGRVIANFRLAMPGVRLEVALSNVRTDLVRDGFDLAIRGGVLQDTSLIARRLAVIRLWLYASPRFANVEPTAIPLIAARGDEQVVATVLPGMPPAVVVVDDRMAVRDAVVAGAGCGVLPSFLGEPSREQGLLLRLLPDPLSAMPVHAVFLREQRRDVRVRALIDILARHLADGLTESP